VHEPDVVRARLRRLDEVLGLGQAFGNQRVVDQPILVGREDVGADVQLILVGIDELQAGLLSLVRALDTRVASICKARLL